MHVLVVDDEEAVRRALNTVLTNEGYEVSVAKSGTEAIDRLSHDPVPDVLLLDMLLEEGGLTGWDVARYRACHHDSRVRGIPTIVLSGLPAPDVRARAFINALEDVKLILEKPINFEHLLAVVRSYAARQVQA